LFLCGQIGLPRLGVPDLEPRVRPDDHAVALQARVLSQALGDRDPALLVRLLVGSAGEEDPAVIAHRLRGERRGTESLGDAPELLYREDVEAALLAFGYHQTLRQLLAILRREEQPSFVIKAWVVGSQEHRPPPVPWERSALQPQPSTAHHDTPLLPTVNRVTVITRGNSSAFS